jgi:hypothetical protein
VSLPQTWTFAVIGWKAVNVLPNWALQGSSWASSSFLIKFYDNCVRLTSIIRAYKTTLLLKSMMYHVTLLQLNLTQKKKKKSGTHN